MSLLKFQTRLKSLGFDPGPLDGQWGKMTEAAAMTALDALPAGAQSGTVMMRTSALGIAAITAHEGIVPGPYLDIKGVLTAYIGHTASAGKPDPAEMPKGMPSSLDDAIDVGFAVFARDLAKFEARVRAAIAVPLAQHEFDAAVSFDFNAGRIHNADWVRSLNRGDRAAAAREIMNFQRPPGVIDRREAEQRLFRDGVYPSKPTPVWRVSSACQVIWDPIMYLSPADVAARVAAVA